MKFLRFAFFSGLAAAVLLALYSLFIEPDWLRVRTEPLQVSTRQGRTLRIVHLTDIHWGNASRRYLRAAFRRAAEQKPDVILLTGDYMDGRVEDKAGFIALMKILPDAAPTYAVQGNHDGGSWAALSGGYENTETIRRLMTEAGVRYLENAYSCPLLKGARVCIGGAGDVWARNFFPERFAPRMDREPADLRLMLLHNPDGKERLLDAQWDLLLAGHTHGGQIVLPWIGSPWAPVLDKRVLKGLFRYEGRWVHISPGVGRSGHRVRFNCRPEVSVLEVGI
jgi:predicted MPP superfamily phosphohydrolase